MQFHFRDKDTRVVEAWRKHLPELDSIKITCGDIFDLDLSAEDAIVSPANCFGDMW